MRVGGGFDDSVAGGDESDGSPDGEMQERKLVCMVSTRVFIVVSIPLVAFKLWYILLYLADTFIHFIFYLLLFSNFQIRETSNVYILNVEINVPPRIFLGVIFKNN